MPSAYGLGFVRCSIEMAWKEKEFAAKHQESMSLESEIDSENQARFQQMSSEETTQEAKCLQEVDKNDKIVSRKTSTTTISSSCNAWSNRVEAIRVLRFSLAGDVVDYEQEEPVYDNFSECGYLRTKGDPGAAGYTIKGAVAITRSVNWNRRKNGNGVNKSVDGDAVWTFALSSEPDLSRCHLEVEASLETIVDGASQEHRAAR
ncbi:transcriptional elongation regulator MINIYO [Trifolium repens]|nr:transcriptional elongation regulator MINIYO [Trifolium repens]